MPGTVKRPETRMSRLWVPIYNEVPRDVAKQKKAFGKPDRAFGKHESCGDRLHNRARRKELIKIRMSKEMVHPIILLGNCFSQKLVNHR